MRKLLPLDDFDDFALHHLPNKYHRFEAQSLATERVVKLQLEQLRRLRRFTRQTWFVTRARISALYWDKTYYMPTDRAAISCLRDDQQRVLSVGVGVGATEATLAHQGRAVTAIPLDATVSCGLPCEGVELCSANYMAELARLQARTFDAILLLDILPHVADPKALLDQCRRLLATEGTLIVRAPNFFHISLVRRVWAGHVPWADPLRLFFVRSSGVHATRRGLVHRWLVRAGFAPVSEPRGVSDEPGAPSDLRSRLQALLPRSLRDRDFLLMARPEACSRTQTQGRVRWAPLRTR